MTGDGYYLVSSNLGMCSDGNYRMPETSADGCEYNSARSTPSSAKNRTRSRDPRHTAGGSCLNVPSSYYPGNSEAERIVSANGMKYGPIICAIRGGARYPEYRRRIRSRYRAPHKKCSGSGRGCVLVKNGAVRLGFGSAYVAIICGSVRARCDSGCRYRVPIVPTGNGLVRNLACCYVTHVLVEKCGRPMFGLSTDRCKAGPFCL